MGLVERDPRRTAATALVRRCTMHPDPALIERLSDLSRGDAVNAILDAEIDGATSPKGDKSNETIAWWFQRMARSPSTLQDRMAFLWHTIIPTNRYGASPHQFVGIQLDMLRANALGNYRELLHGFATDGAMLRYLDGANSTDERTNENFARELMELFSVGYGHYSESDVRAAAKAMTGWTVNKDKFTVSRDESRAHQGEVTFFGETKNWDVHSVVDRLCDHPATAARIGGKVWYHLTGQTLNGSGLDELGVWWQGQDLEIRPLVERIVSSDAFWAEHYVRPRSGFEFYLAALNVVKFDPSELWRPRHLGQMPYEPPNVGGWPGGDRWMTPDALLRRAEQLFSANLEKSRPGSMTASIEDILNAASLWVVSDETMAALTEAESKQDDLGPKSTAQLKWRVALSSPEFQLQ